MCVLAAFRSAHLWPLLLTAECVCILQSVQYQWRVKIFRFRYIFIISFFLFQFVIPLIWEKVKRIICDYYQGIGYTNYFMDHDNIIFEQIILVSLSHTFIF